MKRIRIKTNVIFNQYWTFATMGFSEMKLSCGKCGLAIFNDRVRGIGEKKDEIVREHLSAHLERQRDDEPYKEGHLRHEEHEDLVLSPHVRKELIAGKR